MVCGLMSFFGPRGLISRQNQGSALGRVLSGFCDPGFQAGFRVQNLDFQVQLRIPDENPEFFRTVLIIFRLHIKRQLVKSEKLPNFWPGRRNPAHSYPCKSASPRSKMEKNGFFFQIFPKVLEPAQLFEATTCELGDKGS